MTHEPLDDFAEHGTRERVEVTEETATENTEDVSVGDSDDTETEGTDVGGL
jgi:hypothetical protein